MDPVKLQILEDAWLKDVQVMEASAARMEDRLKEGSVAGWAAAGFEICQVYNVLEKAFERLCETFENNFDKSGSYHGRLIERMELEIRGIRPAFLAGEAGRSVRELKGFRHLCRHAYDLELEPERLKEIARNARYCVARFRLWCIKFLERVRTMEEA